MSIQENLQSIKHTIPPTVTLVAVSKTKPISDLMEAYHSGQRIFGENKIQEMTAKYKQMPKDIQWHMVGHVQTNKIKFIASFVHLIHSVDSLRLLKEINKQAVKNNRIIDCLLQIHIAEEDTKFGLNLLELNDLLKSDTFKGMMNIKIKGLMGMASFTKDQNQIKKEFIHLKSIFDTVLKQNKTPNLDPEIISMGMSNDYSLAIACGSTMIRVGNSIFGMR